MSEVFAVVMIYLTWAAGLAAYFAIASRLILGRQSGSTRALTFTFVVFGGLLVWIPVLPVLLALWFYGATH